MSTPTKAQTLIDSQAANDALTAAANARFIAAADIQIQDATDMGVFYINCENFDTNVDPQAIFNHYSDLGYSVSFPDFPQNLLLTQGPSNLFGEFWINFWTNGGFILDVNKMPIRFLIGWKP